MKLSNIIGKQVFCVYDANFLGTVHDIAFNIKHTKILGLYFFDQEENEYYIKTQNIFSINDFVVIKNTTKISNEFLLDKPLSPLGKNIVDVLGKDYGNISDIEIDENYNIVNFVTNKNINVLPNQILLISKNVVTGVNVKLCSFRPQKRVQKDNLLSNLSVSVMKIQETQEKQKLMPTKITVNSDVLIGKRLTKDIFGKNNELIIKQNQVLNSKLVFIAKQHEKLNELFYSVY